MLEVDVAHLRDGLVKRTLDLFVIGAHKAGTTSLFAEAGRR
jgi:hypothetical protein